MSFSIGPFPFINLSSVIPGTPQRVVREIRPGLNGTSFWKTGLRGEPIQLASVVDCQTVEAAEAQFHDYEAFVGEVVPVTWAGVDRQDIQVMILAVQPIEGGVHAMLLGIGGTIGGASRGLCRALWTVEPIDPHFHA